MCIWNKTVPISQIIASYHVSCNINKQTCKSKSIALYIEYQIRFFYKNISLRWRHNGRDCVSNHQPHHCLLSRLFRRRSKKTSKLRVTGLCAGNSPGTGEFPAEMANNAENASIWWYHHVFAMIKTKANNDTDYLTSALLAFESGNCSWFNLLILKWWEMHIRCEISITLTFSS